MRRNVLISTFAVACAATAALASDEVTVSPKILKLWADHAMPLDEFVAAGYGDAKPKDATDPQWCAYQPLTVGLMYAKHANCKALITKMQELGRI